MAGGHGGQDGRRSGVRSGIDAKGLAGFAVQCKFISPDDAFPCVVGTIHEHCGRKHSIQQSRLLISSYVLTGSFRSEGSDAKAFLSPRIPVVSEPNGTALVVRADSFTGLDGVFKQRAERVCA